MNEAELRLLKALQLNTEQLMKANIELTMIRINLGNLCEKLGAMRIDTYIVHGEGDGDTEASDRG